VVGYLPLERRYIVWMVLFDGFGANGIQEAGRDLRFEAFLRFFAAFDFGLG
jgi:hypothetical protein